MNERRKRKTAWKILWLVLGVFILLAAVGGFFGYRYVMNSLEPVDSESEEVIEVEIPSGASRGEMAEILEEQEVIQSGRIFDYYLRFRGNGNYQAGSYLMSPSMSVSEIVNYLEEGGTPITEQPIGRVTVPEGIHLEFIAERVDENTPFSEEEFMETIQDEAFINQLAEQFPSLLSSALEASDVTRYVLEGYLFPATYEVFEEDTLEELIIQMVGRMDQALTPYYAEIEQGALTVHEILTLASYIEREGVTQEDRDLISGVFYHRLEVGMPLQTDPSVAYAIGEHLERTSYDDLEVDSPYNTYMYPGIGAGPINSPSDSAIQASIHPEETTYLYFLADLETGEVYYSETYDQHLDYQNEYLRNNDE